MSGAINNDEAKQLGKLLDIDALLLGSVVMRTVDSVYTLNLRFVDIRTGEILWSSSYLNVKEDIDKAISVIASSLHKKLFGNKIEKKSKVRIAKNRLFKGKEFKKIAILRLAGPDYISAEKTLRGLLTTYFIGEQVKLVERAALKNILNEQF